MKELVLDDSRRVVVKGTGMTEDVFEETAAPRRGMDNGKVVKGETNKTDFPEGTLDSLRPLLRQVFDNGFDEEAYWAKVQDSATMDPQDAVNKLRAAGQGISKVARELVVSDKLGFENRRFKRLNEDQIKDKISQVASILRPYYRYKK